ncbi:MAG: rhomboid family intramembrane serine protease [Actinobacteria bacterium]|nr:rhomboid family intramembrane serine protease [Actinomycetota bacterium]
MAAPLPPSGWQPSPPAQPPYGWQPPGPPPPPPTPQLPGCYRHPDRQAGVVCQRCDRPICPQCMHQASVGFHCPECANRGRQRVYSGTAAIQAGPRPIATYVLIGINVAVFVLGLLLSLDRVGEALFGGNDRLLTDGGLIARFRFEDGLVHPVGIGQGEWYRLVTSGFLQYGLVHLALNMYALYVLGTVLERGIGRARFVTVYFVSMLVGSFGALLLRPDALTAGASGAIFGLMGAFLAIQWVQGVPIRQSPVIGVLLLNLVITVSLPGISIGGHLGGLAGDFVSGYLLTMLPARLDRGRARPARGLSQGDLLAMGASALIGLGAAAAAMVIYG